MSERLRVTAISRKHTIAFVNTKTIELNGDKQRAVSIVSRNPTTSPHSVVFATGLQTYAAIGNDMPGISDYKAVSISKMISFITESLNLNVFMSLLFIRKNSLHP